MCCAIGRTMLHGRCSRWRSACAVRRPLPDRRGRRAGRQYAPIPAAEGRGDGGGLAPAGAGRGRAAGAFRHSQHGDGEEPRNDRDSARCVVVPDPYLGRDVKGLREFARDDIPYVPIVFFAFRVMVGLAMLMLALAVLGAFRAARRALPDALVSSDRGGDGAGGLSRDAGGMDRHQDGPPALYRLWAAADDQQRLSDRGARRGGLARGFCRCLRHRFRRGGDLPAPADGEGARHGQPGVPNLPIRSAGITPGPAGVMHQAPGGAE